MCLGREMLRSDKPMFAEQWKKILRVTTVLFFYCRQDCSFHSLERIWHVYVVIIRLHYCENVAPEVCPDRSSMPSSYKIATTSLFSVHPFRLIAREISRRIESRTEFPQLWLLPRRHMSSDNLSLSLSLSVFFASKHFICSTFECL